eukprot:12401775-Alexandrium_andersonii.AAC.1
MVQGVGKGRPRFCAARRAGSLKCDLEYLLPRAGRSSSGRGLREPSADAAPEREHVHDSRTPCVDQARTANALMPTCTLDLAWDMCAA